MAEAVMETLTKERPMQDGMILDSPQLPKAPDAYSLIERAVEKGLDPAQLKALVDLHEQMRASRAKEAFNEALKKCQEELPVIIRDAQNTKSESRYATLDNVQKISKPVYTRHGFALSFGEADCTIPNFKRTICDVRHSEGHTERYQLDLPLDGIGPKGNPIGGMNAVQGAISTGSYAQRIMTCRIFNITVSDTDLDGLPPANENPSMRPDAPLAPNRSARRQPPAEHPNVSQVKSIMASWGSQFGTGDKVQDKPAFWQWFSTATQSKTNPASPADWSDAELAACRKALGIPTDSDLGDGK